MTDPGQTLAALREMFPNFTTDLIEGVMECVGGTFEESLEALLSLDAGNEAPNSLVDYDFLEAGPQDGGKEQPREAVRVSVEEVKQGQKSSLSWKQRLKNVFKSSKNNSESASQAPPKPSASAIPPVQSVSRSDFPSKQAADVCISSSSPRHSSPQYEDDDEEIFSFSQASDPKVDRSGKYQEVPLNDDIELTTTKKSQ